MSKNVGWLAVGLAFTVCAARGQPTPPPPKLTPSSQLPCLLAASEVTRNIYGAQFEYRYNLLFKNTCERDLKVEVTPDLGAPTMVNITPGKSIVWACGQLFAPRCSATPKWRVAQ